MRRSTPLLDEVFAEQDPVVGKGAGEQQVLDVGGQGIADRGAERLFRGLSLADPA